MHAPGHEMRGAEKQKGSSGGVKLLAAAGGGAPRLPPVRALAGPMRSVARRSQQLARRVSDAGRSSLELLTTAWAVPPPLSPARARRGGPGAVATGAGGAGGAAAAAALPADADLQLDLDWKAELTFMQEVICWHTAGAVCCVAYALTAPAAVSVPYGTCIALLFGCVVTFMRSSMAEVLYKVQRRRTQSPPRWSALPAPPAAPRTGAGDDPRPPRAHAATPPPTRPARPQAKERFETDLGDPDSTFHTHDNLQARGAALRAPPRTRPPRGLLPRAQTRGRARALQPDAPPRRARPAAPAGARQGQDGVGGRRARRGAALLPRLRQQHLVVEPRAAGARRPPGRARHGARHAGLRAHRAVRRGATRRGAAGVGGVAGCGARAGACAGAAAPAAQHARPQAQLRRLDTPPPAPPPPRPPGPQTCPATTSPLTAASGAW